MKSNMVERGFDLDPSWDSSGKSVRHLVVSQWLNSRRRSWSSFDLSIFKIPRFRTNLTSKLSPIKIHNFLELGSSITHNDYSLPSSSIHPSAKKMPRSKRAKVVHLTKTQKKGKELTLRLYANIRECIPQYPYLYVFSVENMRNNHLKDVRSQLANDSR